MKTFKSLVNYYFGKGFTSFYRLSENDRQAVIINYIFNNAESKMKFLEYLSSDFDLVDLLSELMSFDKKTSEPNYFMFDLSEFMGKVNDACKQFIGVSKVMFEDVVSERFDKIINQLEAVSSSIDLIPHQFAETFTNYYFNQKC